jgi:porin
LDSRLHLVSGFRPAQNNDNVHFESQAIWNMSAVKANDWGGCDLAANFVRRMSDILCDAGRGLLPAFVGLIAFMAVCCETSMAADVAGQATSMSATEDPSLSDLWPQVRDLGGLRSALANRGVQLAFTYYGEALANPSGGVRQGLIYESRLGTIIDADLDKLLGWSGATFHTSIHEINGQGLSAGYVQNLMTVSGIEAPATTRLFNLWLEQAFSDKTSLRVGQFSAAQEFFVSQNANLFINSTFGWPVITAQNLPSGGPAYPEATPGVRLKFTPSDQLTLMAAIFNGDPAGPGSGNPVARDPYGLAFRLRDPPLLIAEVNFAYNQASIAGNLHQEGAGQQIAKAQSSNNGSQSFGLPGSFRLGAWYHAGEFADQRFDLQGLSLFDPRSTGQPKEHRGDFGVYAVIDQMLWRVPGSSDQGLSAFVRASVSPSDRNPVDLYADAGLTYKGLILGRPDDLAGIGVAFGRISPQAAAADQAKVIFSSDPMPIRDYEAMVELTYQARITKDWSVQPDFQYILHPGGDVPNPNDPNAASPIPNAMVIGVRTMVKF